MTALIIPFFLASCNSAPPQKPEPMIVVQRVEVPIAVSCIPDTLPDGFTLDQPATPDTKAAIAAGDVQKRSQLVTAANLELHPWVDVAEILLKACAKK